MSGLATGQAGVASGHRLATEAGIEALGVGGSAVDAALAAAFTQWVVSAPQCGPGGEMVVLVAHDGRGDGTDDGTDDSRGDGTDDGRGDGTDDGTDDSRGDGTDDSRGDGTDDGTDDSRGDGTDDGRGDGTGDGVAVFGGWSRVPLGIGGTRAGASARGWPPTSGPGNAVVPGSLRGAEAAWRAHGRLAWSDLFAGALAAAAGHEVTPRMGDVYRLVHKRGHIDALQRILGRHAAPDAGETVRMPALAATLETIATDGPGALYHGELADRLVAAAAEEGAGLGHDDLAAVSATVEPARRFDLDDIIVWVPGSPSQSPITPALLASVPPDADPASRRFARAVAPLTEQHLTEFCAGGPVRPAGTAVASAADGRGLSATAVHSLAGVQFGTGWVAGDTGVAFSNRVGTALSDRPDLPACNPRPGALLPHTLSAAHVRHRHGPGWMTLATPGGDRQVQWLAQAIQRFRRGAGTEEIAAGPRWFVCPTGDRFGVPAGIGEPWYAFAEPGIEWHDDARLAGYDVRTTANVGGGLQVIAGPTASGDGPSMGLEIASDPRSGGAGLSLGA